MADMKKVYNNLMVINLYFTWFKFIVFDTMGVSRTQKLKMNNVTTSKNIVILS